jgi:hypothetical protein
MDQHLAPLLQAHGLDDHIIDWVSLVLTAASIDRSVQRFPSKTPSAILIMDLTTIGQRSSTTHHKPCQPFAPTALKTPFQISSIIMTSGEPEQICTVAKATGL